MSNEKYNDLPQGVEHIRTILPSVLRDLALKQMKSAMISAHCRGLLSEDVVKRLFARFPGLRGA